MKEKVYRFRFKKKGLRNKKTGEFVAWGSHGNIHRRKTFGYKAGKKH